jgi:ArsR family transcriptional regulator
MKTKRSPKTTRKAKTPAPDDGLIGYELLQPVAETLKAVAHPVRLRIIEVLVDGERYVGELIEALGTKPAITSQQLGLLKDKGILQARREGSRVYYRLANPHVIKVIECIRRACATRSEPGQPAR